ncbi:MAG: cysteine--tRNA ligase [Pseudomonadota bacterium]
MDLSFYNTLTREKAPFEPTDPKRVGLYVCGPTVYDDAHIGNARPIIVFDVLFRLLRHAYGAEQVTYVRNITDVDDKINARAAEAGISISELTAQTTVRFHNDIARLGVLPPTVEPRATDHIAEMSTLIETLVEKSYAYVAEDHVLFSVNAMSDYGALSNRSLEEMEAGARVDVAPYKRDPMDFVLWKPSNVGEPAWPSPCGIARDGRPGWHVECSAMAERHLGATFDIHGGGIDLVFPHHENEVAQSRCAHGTSHLARVWMHNGFLQVEGEKMSKSLGNFITINALLDTDQFGGRAWHGRVLRWAMLQTHYRQPIDWTAERLSQARQTLMEFADLVATIDSAADDAPYGEVLEALADDLNTPRAISILHGLAKSARRGSDDKARALKSTLAFLGVLDGETRDDIAGTVLTSFDPAAIDALIAERLEARARKDFATSDRIRDELAAQGIRLKDGKDPESGAAVTTWQADG